MDGHRALAWRDQRWWVKLLAGLLALAILLALLLVLFPWNLLRGPLNRYVTEKTGRHFEITRRLDVQLGRTTRILADGIEFANPAWARDPKLVTAQGAEIRVRLWPLLEGRIELPLVALHRPQLGLQMEADGRRTWTLGRDPESSRKPLEIEQLVVDDGSAHFVVPQHGADIRIDFAIEAPQAQPAAGAGALPLTFNAKGTWQAAPFTAQGRTGNVLQLKDLRQPFPLEIDARAGDTRLRANGSIASLATLDGADARFQLQGHNLADLYRFVGIVLPATPRYSVQGRLTKQGETWHMAQIDGKLGNSDLKGELSFDRGQPVPLLAGKLHSAALDFDDLAPLVGLPEQPRSAAALPQIGGVAAAPARSAGRRTGPDPKVLPTASMDLDRLQRMEADVSYDAARISHVRQLPLDRLSVHVRLKDGVLRLDPLQLGVAGGTLTGRSTIDGTRDPAIAEVHLNARSLELGKLFPGAKITRASFGRMRGDINLRGRGNSVAQMLGSSSGTLAMLMGSGEISNLLMDLAALDGLGILKAMIRGDRNEQLRCAAAAFDVREGVMSTRALVLDTNDTVVYGDGRVNLADETMALTLWPYPKDMSLLSLRSPLRLAGSFARPSAGPDKGALAGRAGAVLALGAINPLLALAATVETGPGKDANCAPALREAASPYAAARIAAMSKPAAAKGSNVLGAPPASADDPAGRSQPDGKAAVPRGQGTPGGKDMPRRAPVPADRPYGN